MGRIRAAKLLAWIEPTAGGGFNAVLAQGAPEPSLGFTLSAREFLTFAEARDWAEGISVTLAMDIRWMSAP